MTKISTTASSIFPSIGNVSASSTGNSVSISSTSIGNIVPVSTATGVYYPHTTISTPYNIISSGGSYVISSTQTYTYLVINGMIVSNNCTLSIRSEDKSNKVSISGQLKELNSGKFLSPESYNDIKILKSGEYTTFFRWERNLGSQQNFPFPADTKIVDGVVGFEKPKDVNYSMDISNNDSTFKIEFNVARPTYYDKDQSQNIAKMLMLYHRISR